MLTIKIKYIGLDDWNRPVFKNVNSDSHYGSVTTLFNFSDKREDIIEYFIENIHELEYFGDKFGCEPCGGLDSRLRLEIIDKL